MSIWQCFITLAVVCTVSQQFRSELSVEWRLKVNFLSNSKRTSNTKPYPKP